jgi:serine/threonine protein kinase/formylglycine-generating enzyme required for sulfatase activity
VTAGDLDTGARIGRYVIVERVGTGAMGVVYGAYDPELDRKVALKLIKPGQGKDTARARLLREAKAIARLQHPNVVAVHDVGVYEEQVFLAMEFVAGGTIKSWLAAQTRSWREILDVFIAAGRGLAAAHAAGLVHRDFKPDNVLLDKESRPRVVDFGIARQAGGGDDELEGDTGDVDSQDGTQTLRDSSGKHALATLTKTGTWVGTPAYMAPEQFLGERGDEKSDQFSFCVALYEALYGERPFAGDDMLSISVNVTTEHLRPLPKDRGIPNWVRRVILRGLRSNPADRWDGMPAMIAALSSDPVAKLRNRLILIGTAVAFVVSLGGVIQWSTRRRAETEREIARKVEGARVETGSAQRRSAEARDLRARAFAAFDAMDGAQGEQLWRQTRALVPLIDSGFDQAERMFETAFGLDPSRQEIRTQLADVRYEHLLFAEELGLESKARILEERLATVDVNGKRRAALTAPGTLVLHTAPVASQALLERYERDAVTGRRSAKALGPVTGSEPKSLAPGSYRLTMDGTNLAHVVYPFEVRRGERVELDVTLPPASVVPEGFAYVPPGEFWFGDADEILRAQFFDTVPLHRRKTDAYLIARNETTYGEWIQFLDTLPAAQRAKLAPNVSTAIRGFLLLKGAAPGWELTFQPLTQRYTARAGESIDYVGRGRRVRQDWLRFPVAGISPEDARQYAAWLASSGRVPGARLCTEMEWERAARGADARLFPHGDDLDADDANHDVTYGRVDAAYGPDVVGSHPASRSPFGVDDLAGNVWELATSSQKADAVVIRGGSYYFKPVNCRISNREPVPPTFRDATAGIRICSSLGRKN